MDHTTGGHCLPVFIELVVCLAPVAILYGNKDYRSSHCVPDFVK